MARWGRSRDGWRGPTRLGAAGRRRSGAWSARSRGTCGWAGPAGRLAAVADRVRLVPPLWSAAGSLALSLCLFAMAVAAVLLVFVGWVFTGSNGTEKIEHGCAPVGWGAPVRL